MPRDRLLRARRQAADEIGDDPKAALRADQQAKHVRPRQVVVLAAEFQKLAKEKDLWYCPVRTPPQLLSYKQAAVNATFVEERASGRMLVNCPVQFSSSAPATEAADVPALAAATDTRPAWTVPAHHWRMDEAINATVAADTGYASATVNLVLEGSAVFLGPDTDDGGGAALPNGGATKESFLDVGGGSGLAFAAANGVTFAVWAKFESYQNWDNQNSYGRILYLRDSRDSWDSSTSNYIVLQHVQTTRRARVYIENNGGSPKSSTTPDCNPSDRPVSYTHLTLPTILLV